MSKVIIFGTNDLAQLALYYLQTDPNYRQYEVYGFTVHEKYMTTDHIFGKKVFPFEKLQETHPPGHYKLFAPMTGAKMNQNRRDVYLEGKQKGYKFISYISSKATLFDNKIGENCFILENNTIQPFTTIGNNVVMWSGNHIGHHSEIRDHVFFASHVVMSGHCVIEPYCWLGVNSTLRDGLTLAEGTLVAMSASITKNTDPWSAYLGVPSKKLEGKTSLEANP